MHCNVMLTRVTRQLSIVVSGGKLVQGRSTELASCCSVL